MINRSTRLLYKKNLFRFSDMIKPKTDSSSIKKETKTSLRYYDFEASYRLPLKLNGMQDITEAKSSFIFSQILGYSKVSKHWILDYLQRIFEATLLAIEKRDEDFLNEYLESRFAESVLKTVEKVEKDGYTVG